MSADSVNVVLTFEDQYGREWLAAAVMTPLQRSDSAEECAVEAMPDRVFVLKGFRVVTNETWRRVGEWAGDDQ